MDAIKPVKAVDADRSIESCGGIGLTDFWFGSARICTDVTIWTRHARPSPVKILVLALGARYTGRLVSVEFFPRKAIGCCRCLRRANAGAKQPNAAHQPQGGKQGPTGQYVSFHRKVSCLLIGSHLIGNG